MIPTLSPISTPHVPTRKVQLTCNTSDRKLTSILGQKYRAFLFPCVLVCARASVFANQAKASQTVVDPNWTARIKLGSVHESSLPQRGDTISSAKNVLATHSVPLLDCSDVGGRGAIWRRTLSGSSINLSSGLSQTCAHRSPSEQDNGGLTARRALVRNLASK